MTIRPSHAARPAGDTRRSRRQPERTGTRSRAAGRRRSAMRRNRRRGAPRSLVVRRLLALVLAGCAGLLLLRPSAAAPAAAAEESGAEQQPPGIPLVLPLADSATASVLQPGQKVDLYAAHGDSPPSLTLTGVPLLDITTPESAITGTGAHGAGTYIVVHLTPAYLGSVEGLLAATSIVATVSAVDSD